MKFLLFNLVVAGALFYLFAADKTGAQSAAGAAHSVIDQIEGLATKTVAKVNVFNNGGTKGGGRSRKPWRGSRNPPKRRRRPKARGGSLPKTRGKKKPMATKRKTRPPASPIATCPRA